MNRILLISMSLLVFIVAIGCVAAAEDCTHVADDSIHVYAVDNLQSQAVLEGAIGGGGDNGPFYSIDGFHHGGYLPQGGQLGLEIKGPGFFDNNPWGNQNKNKM